MAHYLFLIFFLFGNSGSYPAAHILYQNGDYQKAVTLARSIETAEAAALAARAGLVLAAYIIEDEAEALVLLEAALQDAERGLALVPDHAGAHLQAAIAQGYRGQINRSIADVRAAKSHIEAALRQEPDNPWANAAMGGWYGYTRLGVGAFLGRMVFGTSRSKAIKWFEQALVVDPENVAIRVGFADILLQFDKPRYDDMAQDVLQKINPQPDRTEFESMMAEHGDNLLQALVDDDQERLKSLLVGFVPFIQKVRD